MPEINMMAPPAPTPTPTPIIAPDESPPPPLSELGEGDALCDVVSSPLPVEVRELFGLEASELVDGDRFASDRLKLAGFSRFVSGSKSDG